MDRKIRPEILWILIISFLYIPLLYAYMADLIGPRARFLGTEWTGPLRFGIFGLSTLCVLLALFFDRKIRSGSAGIIFSKSGKEAGTGFLYGIALILLPSCAVLFLFLMGHPRLDMYIVSAFSFAGILAWTWRHRSLLREETGFQKRPAKETYPRNIRPRQILQANLVPSYTFVLLAVGLLTCAFLCLRVWLVMNSPGNYKNQFLWKAPSISFDALVISGCWITAFWRFRSSPKALKATGIISTILIAGFPVGTAVFFYWFASVRRREMLAGNS